MEEEPQPCRLSRAPDRAPWTAWGLPPSAASRRDTEDMLARVSRTEAESSDAYRRIEEQLRTVGRRLDSAERSQSENNRAMSKTATRDQHRHPRTGPGLRPAGRPCDGPGRPAGAAGTQRRARTA